MPRSATRTPDAQLCARITEFFETWQPWPRRLWDLGTLLSLRETVEAADWVGDHVLSQSALTWHMRESLLPRLGSDRALGDQQVRRQLEDTCKRSFSAGTSRQRTLNRLADIVEDGYLERWKTALKNPGDVHIERSSRYVAAHMLDLGFHPDFLRRSIKKTLRKSFTIEELIDFFIELTQSGSKEYTAIIALQSQIPEPKQAQASGLWVSAEKLAQHLAGFDFGNEPIRQSESGGFEFKIKAMDPTSAAQSAIEILDRLANRVRYLRGQQKFNAYPFIFILGEKRPFPIRDLGDSSVNILSFTRAQSLYNIDFEGSGSSQVDEALELAAALTRGTPSTAAAGAWAAIESLLFCAADQGDDEQGRGRAVAADRAAAILTASWPRSELTALSYRVKGSATLAARLRSAGESNQHRARILSEWIGSNGKLIPENLMDEAAISRMRDLHDAPYQTLGRVNRYMRTAIRRLYRQRNIVLHGGTANSVALRATVRTTGPLVGAVLDRIVHGYSISGVSPLDIAARAEISLRIASDAMSPPLSHLLGA